MPLEQLPYLQKPCLVCKHKVKKVLSLLREREFLLSIRKHIQQDGLLVITDRTCQHTNIHLHNHNQYNQKNILPFYPPTQSYCMYCDCKVFHMFLQLLMFKIVTFVKARTSSHVAQHPLLIDNDPPPFQQSVLNPTYKTPKYSF